MAEIRTYATPMRLYRYRALTEDRIEQELDAIRDGYVFCPTIDRLNDPMEGSHRESSMLRETPNLARTIEEVRNARSQLGVASFSETYRHEPMWAYYAGNFEGMCVAYSLRQLLKALPPDHDFVRMSYSEKPPMLLRGGRSADQRARLVLSAKTVRWASEREWRLISPGTGPARYGPAACVTRIYLGARAERLADRIEDIARPLGIRVYVMSVDQYALRFTNRANPSHPDD